MPALMETPVQVLERRLAQGAEILFDMEQRGETGPEYTRWLEAWVRLLDEYEARHGETLAA